MKKVLISAGHSNVPGRDRGAAGNGYIEGELAVDFRNLLIPELLKLGIDVHKDIDNSILSETISDFKLNVSSDTISIDIHWNAGPATATGTEVLIPESNSSIERNLAKDIADTISRILNIPLRGNYKGLKGVKTEAESQHKKLGFMRLNGETILIEMCFISNKSDMDKYQDNKKLLAKEIANLICQYATSDTSNIKPIPNVLVNTHTVVKGDSLSKIAYKYSTTVANIKTLNSLKSDVITIGQLLKLK